MSGLSIFDVLSESQSSSLYKVNSYYEPTVEDVTSIVDDLESNKGLFQTNRSLAFLVTNLKKIQNWANSTLLPLSLLSDEQTVEQLQHEIKLLRISLKRIGNSIRNESHKKKRKDVYQCWCSECYENIFVRNNINAWNDLQAHEHIENALANWSLLGKTSKKNIDKTDYKSDKMLNSNIVDETIHKELNNKNQIEENKDFQLRLVIIPTTDIKETIPNIEKTLPVTQLKKSILSERRDGRETLFNLKSKFEATHIKNNRITSKKIVNFLYPPFLVSAVRNIQEDPLVTVQTASCDVWTCLLCKISLTSKTNIEDHVKSIKHRMLMETERSKVVSYHKVFSKVNLVCQMQQTFFYPGKSHDVYCKVCKCKVPNMNITEHIIGKTHSLTVMDKQYSNYYFYEYYNITYDKFNMSDIKHSTIETATSSSTNTISNGSEGQNSECSSNDSNKIDVVTTKNINEKKNKKELKQHDIQNSMKENPSSVFEEIEHRFVVHKSMIQIEESLLFCIVCDLTFNKNGSDLKQHLLSPGHIRLTRNKAEIKRPWTFYCDLCLKFVNTEIKWAEHLAHLEHKQKVMLLKANQQKKYVHMEYECWTCYQAFFGNSFSVTNHKRQGPFIGKKKKPKEYKLPEVIVRLLEDPKIFEQDLYKLLKESKDVLIKYGLNWECCRALQEALYPVFGKCKAYPFGSRISGLGNLSSDLDIFLDLGSMYDGMFYQDAESQKNFVIDTAKALKKHPSFSNVVSIPGARTPIVQAFHKVTHLDCDISFRHGLSVENTEFLRLCIDAQPYVKLLILMLKKWSALCGFSERITTYALAMLVIFFMQINEYLPTLVQIRKIDNSPYRIIAGWATFRYTKSFMDLKQYMKPCNLQSRELLSEFFKYFSTFDYETHVICPLLGRIVPKIDFQKDKGAHLPAEMKTYVDKINASEENEVFRSLSPFCIQDPFDLSHNLTKACPKDLLNKFVTLCALSHHIIYKNPTMQLRTLKPQ